MTLFTVMNLRHSEQQKDESTVKAQKQEVRNEAAARKAPDHWVWPRRRLNYRSLVWTASAFTSKTIRTATLQWLMSLPQSLPWTRMARIAGVNLGSQQAWMAFLRYCFILV